MAKGGRDVRSPKTRAIEVQMYVASTTTAATAPTHRVGAMRPDARMSTRLRITVAHSEITRCTEPFDRGSRGRKQPQPETDETPITGLNAMNPEKIVRVTLLECAAHALVDGAIRPTARASSQAISASEWSGRHDGIVPVT